MTIAHSFNYCAATDARVLILGSMPGVASLQAQRYYANPRNQFWPIVLKLLNAVPTLNYEQRLHCLLQHKIALWDVLAECKRRGSLDANIERDSIRCNDFATFSEQHPQIQCVAFNGHSAAQLFRRYASPTLSPKWRDVRYIALPSTSPAHANLSFDDKFQAWQSINAFVTNEAMIVASPSTR